MTSPAQRVVAVKRPELLVTSSSVRTLACFLALLLSFEARADVPVDAPVAPLPEAIEAKSAVIGLLNDNFIAKGHGCWLDAPRCVEVGRALASARVRAAAMDPEPVPSGYIIAAAIGLTVGIVLGGWVMLKACSAVPSLCR